MPTYQTMRGRAKTTRRWMRQAFKLLCRLPGTMGNFPKQVKFNTSLNLLAWPVMNAVGARYRAATRKRQSVVVIVGSLGKTTTTRATMNVLTGDTPDWIHAWDNCFSLIGINLMRQGPRAPFAVIEAGIGSRGQMAQYASLLQPDIAVVTSIGTDHLRRLGGAEGLWEEKSNMVRALPPSGVAILNGDDAAVMRMAGVTRARILTFGMTPACDVFADNLTIDAKGSCFTLHAEGKAFQVRSRLIGRAAVRAQVAAAAVGRTAGIGFESILPRLQNQAPTPGRMQPIPLGNGAIALCDDFKGSFETFHAALEVMGQIQAHRRVVVLGSLYRPPTPRVCKYEAIGNHAARVADRVILVGARANLYRKGLSGLLPDHAVTTVRTVAAAADLLRAELQPEDIVLLKGRGEQKLSRIALALSHVKVGCHLEFCPFENVLCQACPKLGVG